MISQPIQSDDHDDRAAEALAAFLVKAPAHLPVRGDDLHRMVETIERNLGGGRLGRLWLRGCDVILRIDSVKQYVGTIVPLSAIRVSTPEAGEGNMQEFADANDPGALDDVIEWLRIAAVGETLRTGGGAAPEVMWACHGVALFVDGDEKSRAFWTNARKESNRLGSWRSTLDQLAEGVATMAPASAELFLGWVRSVDGWRESRPAVYLSPESL